MKVKKKSKKVAGEAETLHVKDAQNCPQLWIKVPGVLRWMFRRCYRDEGRS
jgi:hypothetical protein